MLVLLDTTVAAGVVRVISASDQEKEQQENKSKSWIELVKSLIKNLDSARVVIPTPVFYELASLDKRMHKELEKISKDSNPGKIFSYCKYSITPDILIASARLRVNADTKIDPIDSILGAYCLENNYCIITANQKHYPTKFFDAVEMCLAPLVTEKSERTVVYLLKPKNDEWEKLKK